MRGEGHVLRLLLLADREPPYDIPWEPSWGTSSVGGRLIPEARRRRLHGLQAMTVGRTKARCERAMRALLGKADMAAFVERAYGAAGKKNPFVLTRRSRIAGEGVFARRDIPARVPMEEVTRPLVPYSRVPQKGDPGYGHAVQIERGWWLLLNHSLFYFLNHSCDPNVRVETQGAQVRVASTRVIPQGQELTLDYGTVAFKDDPYSFPCTCGSRRCQGVVRGRRR